MKKILAMIVAAGMFMPVIMTAQEKKSPEDQFKAMDKDNDGKLTKSEYVGNREGDKKSKAEERFANLDTNKDGNLSLEEYRAGSGKKKDK